MTLGQLFQTAKERVSTLDCACDSVKEGSPEFTEVTGRYEEAKVFLDLISQVVAERATGETIVSLTADEYRDMRQERRELAVKAERWDAATAHMLHMEAYDG